MSAFEHYQKNLKKKPPKIKIPRKLKMTSSTPLEDSQDASSIFAGITPLPSSANLFLGSPLAKEQSDEKPRKKDKKRRRKENGDDASNNGNGDSQNVFMAKKLRPSFISPYSVDTQVDDKEPTVEAATPPESTAQEVSPGPRSPPPTTTPKTCENPEDMLAWFLNPITVKEFMEEYWEKQPLFIPRNSPNYFEGVCSKRDLEDAFRKCPVYLQKNVTITAYKNGERTNDSTPGRARPAVVWDMYNSGHSIRVLNPQTFVPNVGTIVATLQEYFRNMVGVNSYLTPPGTQGFAPHYDDIEAFVIQMEGEKEWKVYAPRSESEILPKFSSEDFQESDLGPPVMEMTVRAGDLLYFPRGWIHQARSVEGQHSLHLTVSTYQCNSWGDYFKQVLPSALDNAIANSVELRKGLPLDFLDEMGVSNCSSETDRRQAILAKATQLFSHILDHCAWDEAADQLGKEFIHSSFPPPHEQLSEYNWNRLMEEPTRTSIKLISPNVCRICALDDDRLICYYSTDNSLEPKGEELIGFEVSQEEANVIQRLRESYPSFTKCRHLLSQEFNEENLTDLLAALAQRCIVKVKFLKKFKSRTNRLSLL